MKPAAVKRWLLTSGLCLSLSGIIAAQDVSAQAEATPATEPDYATELPRIAPLTVEAALKSFEVQPGFRVDLVAAEPLVKDPVAFAFNGAGQLFVAEMRDYSEQETEHLGSIALLTDTDRDGQMDRRSTFAEKLSWPTAVWPWKDGVVVAVPPQLIWLRDTDGDGVSDQRVIWYDGFGRTNVQGLVNSLRWTVDGHIHGATSSSGAELKHIVGGQGAEDITSLRGRDFVIDPLTTHLKAASGGGQHGMCFNRWGDKFATSNSDHLQQIIDLDQWLSGHSMSVPIPSLRRSIAVDGPQAEVYRSSPVEPWRIVRTRLRMSGAVPGVVEGGGRAAGYFTGATGTWVMDREAGFGSDGFDTALVCDVGSNLVHRKRLIPEGLFWSGERIDDKSELLRSSDIWFRPVQLGDGPDGALYIADMYREVIEHPKSLPPVIKRHLDLTSGNDRGRIWRVVPTTATVATSAAQTLTPASLSTVELASLLHHPVAWQRRMASQLLIERKQLGAIAALGQIVIALEQSCTTGPRPEGRLLAMYVLERYGQLSDTVLRRALTDPHPRVVAHAILLAGREDRAAKFAQELSNISATDPNVQLALSMAATSLPAPAKTTLLRKLMSVVTEPITRATIIVSAGNASPQLVSSQSGSVVSEQWLKLLLPAWTTTLRKKPTPPDAEFRQAIAKLLHSELADESSTREFWTNAISQMPNRASADLLLNLLSEEPRRKFNSFLQTRVDGATTSAASVQKPSMELRWLRLLPRDALAEKASELINPNTLEPVQLAVVEALMWNDPHMGIEHLLPELPRMTPSLKSQVLTIVLGYSQALDRVADALERQEIAKVEIAPDVRQQLFAGPNKQQAERFKKLLSTASADRAQVIARYLPALAKTSELTSDQIAAGRMTFQRICAQCHRLQDVGNDVGPPLKQLADKSPDQLLDIILDPNREVDPKFLGYSVLLEDGRVLAGIIREESAGQIVLAETGGRQHTIARGEIEQLKTTGLSLMPIGLEEQITAEQMTQLIGYLKQAGSK